MPPRLRTLWLVGAALALAAPSCTRETPPPDPAPAAAPKPAKAPEAVVTPPQDDPASSGSQEKTTVPRPAPGSEPQSPRSAPPPADLLTYPRDKDRVMATVNGRKVTLEEIVGHVDERHYEGFRELVSTDYGQLEIRHPRMADWTRQYADMLALRTEARARGVKEEDIKRNSGAAYERAFTAYARAYEERTKRPFPNTDEGLAFQKKAFLKARGLSLEVEGLLDTLVPDQLDRAGVTQFYKDHHESMNGVLRVSQIFIRNRDRKTGAVLTGEAMTEVRAKVQEIERRLKSGTDFEEVAAALSEDRKSASQGGILENLSRFDPRMPASFCRAAWGLPNGQWVGPIQTRFGLHFVKRIEWIIKAMIVRPDPDNKDVRRFVRTLRKEDELFAARKKHRVTLDY